MGMRIIARDHENYFLAAKSLTKLENIEYVVVKALATLHAAKFRINLSLHKILLEGDALPINDKCYHFSKTKLK
jgi:hypothetical protein